MTDDAIGGLPADVVDLHTHLFNLKYLPIRGILRRWRIPGILSVALEKLLLMLMEDEQLEGVRTSAIDRRPEELDLSRDIVEAIARDTPREIFLDEDFLAGLAYVESLEGEPESNVVMQLRRAAHGSRDGVVTPSAIARSLQLSAATSAVRLDLIERFLRKIESLLENGAGKLRFLRLLTRSEERILSAYVSEYAEVDVFVHHMMDLGPHYGGDKPQYDFPSVQLRRMLQLAATTGDRMRIFVAFSPYRDDGLPIVQECVRLGATGVKFYPPSGYRATGNRDGDFKDAPPAYLVDVRNDALFAWCAAKGVPIFAHCTPAGFEAGDDYGLASDPDYWRPALDKHPDLRLCLGHAGGADGWFQPNTQSGDAAFRKSFAGRVLELVRDFEHVYADFAYLDEVLDPSKLVHLRERLTSLIAGVPRLADRMCYGSDWHMLYQELKSDKYLHAFSQLFTHPSLQQYQLRFFRENALRYLG